VVYQVLMELRVLWDLLDHLDLVDLLVLTEQRDHKDLLAHLDLLDHLAQLFPTLQCLNLPTKVLKVISLLMTMEWLCKIWR